MGQSAEPAPPAEALSAVVQRLRSELDGLRRAMRNRAVIEQAKGVLAARLQINPEDAFDQLLDLSQRTNTKLVEVAASLVGTVAPDPDDPPVTELYGDELRELVARRRRRTPVPGPAGETASSPQREALQSQQQLLASRIASARSYAEITDRIVDTVTAWPRLSTVVLMLAELDGALRLEASDGLSAEVASQWTRIPPQVEVPLNAAMATRRAVLLDEAQLTKDFPLVLQIAPDTRAMACLPLVTNGHLVGVLGLTWREPVRLAGLNRRYLLALADICARTTARLAGLSGAAAVTRDAEPRLTLEHRLQYGLLPIVLEPLADPAALLSPITDDDHIVDFEFEYANPAAREFAATENIDLLNSTLLEVLPEVGSLLLLGEFAAVLRTGKPYQLDDLYVAAEREGTHGSYTFSAHATRLGDRVLTVWRIHTDAAVLHDQLLQAERIARAGSFWWNLRSGDLRWSPELHRLFGRPLDDGAVGLDELAEFVHGEDWLGVQNAVNRLLAGRPAEVEFRLTGHTSGRRLRLRAEPLLEDSEVYAISGIMRDVSEERAAEARLRRASEALASQRLRLESERHAAASLRDSVLPRVLGRTTTPGLVVHGLHRSPEGGDWEAGDWFDVLALPDRTVLVVGDVAGRGLAAATAATQLRSAIRGYAVLGMSPAALLTALNQMLCELDPDRLSTLAVADFSPEERRLRWSVAGQGPPVRYRADGSADVLQGPIGLPIGAVPEPSHADSSLILAPGERLLLYTDGLIARRDVAGADGLEVLTRAGHDVDLDDLDALVDHVTEKLGSLPHDDLCVVTATVPE
ncbi:MAG: SpoIIE family protein phosphatase [Micromonosporaceae bacterium]